MISTVAISSDFLTAFAALPRQAQARVTDFLNKFRNNPTSPGINYEKINSAADNKICSVRIDDTYRGIVARQKETGVYLLLWIDHHDAAYEWARRKKCVVNPTTGSVQVFNIVPSEESESSDEHAEQKPGLFDHISDNDLLMLGVPEEQLAFTRSLSDPEELYQNKSLFPSDAYENLEWLANGFSVEDVLSLYNKVGPKGEVKSADLSKALQTPESKKSFVVIEGEEELLRIMSEPLEKWRVFLHPSQRAIVEKNYSGPVKVLGGAGTGKTVVAMHRAKWLAGKMSGKERLLFTTFTANLAGDIKENLKKICSTNELRRIEVIHLDAWVSQFLREQGYTHTIVYNEVLDEIWKEAIALSGEDLNLSTSFFSEEWSRVVAEQDAFTLEEYLKASRVGRGTRLDRKMRIQVWRVFEEYINILRERKIRDIDTAMYECRKLIEKSSGEPRYKGIIVDEGQDFDTLAFKLLRTLAGTERPNDLFIVGDTHQRIYKRKTVLSKSGINVRGRSSKLRINYRTTEEIRKYAFALLKGIAFDDMDDDYDEGKMCQSLTHGNRPEVYVFKNANEELNFIVNKLREMESSGVDLKTVCLVARTKSLVNDYIAGLTSNGLKTYKIKRSNTDDHFFEGVRVATMHRVKGLEFRHMIIAAANKRIVPLAAAISHTDPVSEAESITAEKCLLYVALTRAQESAIVTYYGAPSEFLV